MEFLPANQQIAVNFDEQLNFSDELRNFLDKHWFFIDKRLYLYKINAKDFPNMLRNRKRKKRMKSNERIGITHREII